jgi:hypothetical protein
MEVIYHICNFLKCSNNLLLEQFQYMSDSSVHGHLELQDPRVILERAHALGKQMSEVMPFTPKIYADVSVVHCV